VLIRCLDEFVQSVRLGSNEVVSDDGRKKAETCKEDCKYVTITLEGDNIVDVND
jgi:hypothetical protein